MDLTNGLFEFLGGFFVLLHVRRIVKDKSVKGISIPAMTFFVSWGIWNLFYYPSLDQWWSFLGGLFIVLMNCLWVGLMIYYSWKENHHGN